MIGWQRRRVALLVLGFCVVSGVAVADDEDDEGRKRRGEHRFAVEADVQLDVEIVQGRIDIDAWNHDEVRIRARGSGAGGLRIEADPGWISVRGGAGGGFFGMGAKVDLRIDVPKGAHIQAKTINGNIRLDDIEGRISLHAVNGSIDVDGAPEEARLETLTSSIDFRGKDSSVDARSISGSISLRGVAGEVTATSTSGSLRVRGAKVEQIDLRTLSGSIDIDAELEEAARVYAKTHSGTVTLVVPEDTAAYFDAETLSGRIKNAFGAKSEARNGAGARTRFRDGRRFHAPGPGSAGDLQRERQHSDRLTPSVNAHDEIAHGPRPQYSPRPCRCSTSVLTPDVRSHGDARHRRPRRAERDSRLRTRSSRAEE